MRNITELWEELGRYEYLAKSENEKRLPYRLSWIVGRAVKAIFDNMNLIRLGYVDGRDRLD